MKFKDFRDLIFSPCYVVLGQTRCFVETHQPTDFDEYEVEGVRANTFDEFDECVVVDLVERAIDTNEHDEIDLRFEDKPRFVCHAQVDIVKVS